MKEISSLQHPLVKHLVKLRKERAYRYEQKLALVESRKMIAELSPKLILTTNENEPLTADDVIFTSTQVIEKISGMQTPEGIIAVVEMADHPLKNVRRLLALDGISDPGNLGVLLRTALALGWDGAFLLPNCCDPYNDKALSAARGATFKLPIKQGAWQDLEQIMHEFQLQPLAAEMNGKDIEELAFDKVLLVLGNEAHGPSDETKARCQTVAIPISNRMESLNVAVAGGILMYKL